MSEPGGPDERDLVLRCNRGDEAAWSVFYRRYQNRVHGVTHWRRWRFSPEEADEVMQEVFLALVASLRTFDFRSSLATFVSRVAMNRCISTLRSRLAERAGGRIGHSSLGSVEAVLEDPNDPPDEHLILREQREIVDNGLRSLGKPCQSLVRFRFVEEFSYQEMAALLGVQEGTVASRLSRCLAELREICARLSRPAGKEVPRVATKSVGES